MTTLSKDEVVKMAREAGAVFDPQWGIASNIGTATFERFATLCRAPLVAKIAALKQQLDAGKTVFRQDIDRIGELVAERDALKAENAALRVFAKYAEHIDATPENQRETMLHDALTERDALKADLAAIKAGQQFMKENKDANR